MTNTETKGLIGCLFHVSIGSEQQRIGLALKWNELDLHIANELHRLPTPVQHSQLL